MDKFRVISDLHLDINARFNVSFRRDSIFTVVAGDLGGDIEQDCKWLKKNISQGVFVAGNHIVYNASNKALEDFKEELHAEYPKGSSITFLDESVGLVEKEVDGIVFLGSTLYTDYKYKTYDYHEDDEQTIARNMRYANLGLNDFCVGKTTRDDSLGMLYPTDYKKWHERTIAAFEDSLTRNKDKDVVIVTHHCPSPKCISKQYVGNELNASYVSDLEDFIQDHKNIKCWCCGHVHHKDSFKLGDCLIVMNPLGYCKYMSFSEGGRDWSFNTFVNTKTWELEVQSCGLTKIKRAYKAERERVRKLYEDFAQAFMI